MFELGTLTIEYPCDIKDRAVFRTVINTAADDKIQFAVGFNRYAEP